MTSFLFSCALICEESIVVNNEARDELNIHSQIVGTTNIGERHFIHGYPHKAISERRMSVSV